MKAAVESLAGELILPDDLTEYDQWGLWRREGGTKVPYSLSGYRASSTDPNTWCAFEDALQTYEHTPEAWAGLAWFFSENDPFVGIDIDCCLDDAGAVKPWAQGTIGRFFDTYMEISPSGGGIKIWSRGKLPANLGSVAVEDGWIELYDHARFFAVTGRAFRGAPLQVEDHATDVLLLHEDLTAERKGWTYEPRPEGRIPYGQQHWTLVSLAGTLRRRRLCDEAILACLLAVNQHQCERPGPDENIKRIVRSTRGWS